MSNAVTSTPAASTDDAVRHFEAAFAFETDCWDTHEALAGGEPGFVLLDVRSPALFARGHIAGAVSLPHGKIVAAKMSGYAPEILFVTYCAGPHCNGAARGALRLARLGYSVKLMAGGITGWIDRARTVCVRGQGRAPARGAVLRPAAAARLGGHRAGRRRDRLRHGHRRLRDLERRGIPVDGLPVRACVSSQRRRRRGSARGGGASWARARSTRRASA